MAAYLEKNRLTRGLAAPSAMNNWRNSKRSNESTVTPGGAMAAKSLRARRSTATRVGQLAQRRQETNKVAESAGEQHANARQCRLVRARFRLNSLTLTGQLYSILTKANRNSPPFRKVETIRGKLQWCAVGVGSDRFHPGG